LAVETLEHEFGSLIWDRMETPLHELCSSKRLDTHSILEKIIALPVPTADAHWDNMPIYWLVDRLTLDHVAFRDTDMPPIFALMEEERRPVYPDGYGVKLLIQEFRHFQADFTQHRAEEEEFLFPKIMRNEACFRFPDLGPEVFRGSVNLFLKLETHKPEAELGYQTPSVQRPI
jgi:hypothetical protein